MVIWTGEGLSGVASITPGTTVIQTVEVVTVTDFSFDRTPPPLTSASGIPSSSTHTIISDSVGHLEAVQHTTDKDGDKAKTETPAKASSDWSEESPEAKPESASNLTDSPDHHTDPRTPPPSETVSSPLKESGFHMESNTPLPVAWNEATRTTRRPEGGQEKTGTDVVSVEKCSGCHLKDQTMETVTDPTVVREEPTLAMAAKQEVIQGIMLSIK